MFFQTPLLLALLLIPFGFFIRAMRADDDPLKDYFSKEIRQKLFVPTKGFSTQNKYMLFLLIISLFIIAMARPVKALPFLDINQDKSSIILAIDMSASMHKSDIFPTRKTLAKAKAQSFIQKATDANIGVIFYAKDAYMLYPISQENDLLLSLLKDANITQKFSPNSNLFAALEASASLLKNHQNRHIVLLSDGGADIQREEELAFLRANDIALCALAITPTTNHALKTLCTKTSGLYQDFSWSDNDISTLISHIKQAKKSSQSIHHDIPQYKEYFRYPLALAILLLALLFLPLKTSLMLFFIYTQPASLHAGALDFWHIYQAQKTSQNQHYTQAIKHYQRTTLTPKTHYNLAYTLYKDAQYHKAIQHYKKALGISKKMDAKVYYNIATAYARAHKLELAKKFYAKSLALHPTKITQENLQTITRALKKQRKNRHKKSEKIHFKAIGQNPAKSTNPFSNYSVKLQHFIPSEEERWFQKVAKHSSPTYIQKIKTQKRSIDANLSW